jgi:hypothetical protein
LRRRLGNLILGVFLFLTGGLLFRLGRNRHERLLKPVDSFTQILPVEGRADPLFILSEGLVGWENNRGGNQYRNQADQSS